MKRQLTLILALSLLGAATMDAQSKPFRGRLSFFGSMLSADYDDGTTRDLTELRPALVLRSNLPEDGSGFEYALDLRGVTWPSGEGRSSRTTVYDAWIGGRTAGGRLSLRAGQMWLHELGGIGSVGGAMAELRVRPRLRAGAFAGLEPKNFEAGYVSDRRKGGAWLSFDGEGSRRHVLGYVLIRASDLTERSVVTTTNILPLGRKLLLYQTAEYDLSGPGGQGDGGLHTLFANARYHVTPALELLGTYHHGRSVDTRTITEDILSGRPVDQKSLDGFLFESAGGRITFAIVPKVRVHAGYARDRNNRDDESYGRLSAGVWATDIGGSGFDATVSDNRIDRPGGSQDAWYVSLGRTIGTRLYLSADYATSLSVIRVTGSGGTVVESRPRTKRAGLNGVWNLHRSMSLILNAEQVRDDTSTSDRLLLGAVYRF